MKLLVSSKPKNTEGLKNINNLFLKEIAKGYTYILYEFPFKRIGVLLKRII